MQKKKNKELKATLFIHDLLHASKAKANNTTSLVESIPGFLLPSKRLSAKKHTGQKKKKKITLGDRGTRQAENKNLSIDIGIGKEVFLDKLVQPKGLVFAIIDTPFLDHELTLCVIVACHLAHAT